MAERDAMTRRRLLALASAVPLGALAGCRESPPLPEGIVVDLRQLGEGQRVVVMRDEEPVELLRRAGEIRARSLWCTHFGCRVRWVEQHGLYHCPCHDGIFDAEGNVVSGPPPRPLRAVPFTLLGDRLVLAPRAPEATRPPPSQREIRVPRA